MSLTLCALLSTTRLHLELYFLILYQKSQSNMPATTPAPVPIKDLKEWHTPSSRTEVIHELINGVG